MLTDQERKEIVDLVEDFKEKTKRPNSIYKCWREGFRLVVALAKIKIGPDNTTSNLTSLCTNNRSWTSLNKTNCETDMHGIELNTDGFRYCYQMRLVMSLNKDEFIMLNGTEEYNLNHKNYFYALRRYIERLRMLYNHRFSIFEHDAPNESQGQMFIGKNIAVSSKVVDIFSNNLLGIISIIFCLIIGMVLLFLICQFRQFKNYLNQRNATNQLMTPIQPVEIVEKRRENEENEETTKPLLNL